MGGLIADEWLKEGYKLELQVEAALPMAVWAVDLEIECVRDVSAAELATLRLINSGTDDIAGLTRCLGMEDDRRLAERVLVKLLGAGTVEAKGDGFILTSTGHAWMTNGSALKRERVTYEVRLEPTRNTFEWVDHERPVFATPDTWTIELPPVGDEALLDRKAEFGKLIRENGLPDNEESPPEEQRSQVELRGFSIVSQRIHWRQVRLDFLKHPLNQDVQLVGYIDEAENPPLTKLLTRHAIHEERRRIEAR